MIATESLARALRSAAVALFASGCLVSIAVGRTDDTTATRVNLTPVAIRGELALAAERLADELERVALLCRDLESRPEPDPEQRAFLAAVLEDPPASFERAAHERKLPLAYVIEIHLARVAHHSLRELLAADDLNPPYSAPDFARFASHHYVAARAGTPRDFEVAYGAAIDTSLARALAARHLVFAALREDRLFPAPNDRADFITHLLLAGAESEALAHFVVSALAPPFHVGWGTERLAFPAGKFARHRGKVGFTAEHEAIVRDYAHSIRAARDEALAAGEPDPFVESFLPAAEAKVRHRNPRGYFPRFVATVSEWIDTELHPKPPYDPSRDPAPNLEAAERAWTEFLTEFGAPLFWQRAKPVFEALAAGSAPHRHDVRIAELEDRAAALDALESAELAALRRERAAEELALLRLLPELLALHAPVADAFAELLSCDRCLSDHGRDAVRDSVLAPAFGAAAYRDGHHAATRLADAITGTAPQSLPPAARTALIRSVAAHAATVPGGGDLLARVARHGSDADRKHALVAIALQPPAVARELVSDAIADCRAAMATGADGFDLRVGIFRALEYQAANTTDQATREWVATRLVATLEDDSVKWWRTGLPISRGDPAGERSWRWFANAIPAPDWERLTLAGKIPPTIAAYRDR